MNTKKTSWIFISAIAILNILLFLSDVITIVEFNIATSLIIIVSSIICIIECKERKKIRYLLSIVVIIYIISSICTFANDKTDKQIDNAQIELQRNNFINKYFKEDKKVKIKDLLSEKKNFIEYNGYTIELSYIYEKELKIAYIELTITNPEFGQEYMEIGEELKYTAFIDKLKMIGINEDKLGITDDKTDIIPMIPTDYVMKQNTVILYYDVPHFGGNIYLYDFNKNTCIEEFALEDTVNETYEMANGIYLSPLGIFITGNDENKYNCAAGFDIELEYSDGSKKNINDIYSVSDFRKDYTEITDTNYAYYLFKEVQDIKKIRKIYINRNAYDIDT